MEGRVAYGRTIAELWNIRWAGAGCAGHGARAGSASWIAAPTTVITAIAAAAHRKRSGARRSSATPPPTAMNGYAIQESGQVQGRCGIEASSGRAKCQSAAAGRTLVARVTIR